MKGGACFYSTKGNSGVVWNDLYFTEVIIWSGTSLELAAVTQLQWLQRKSLDKLQLPKTCQLNLQQFFPALKLRLLLYGSDKVYEVYLQVKSKTVCNLKNLAMSSLARIHFQSPEY